MQKKRFEGLFLKEKLELLDAHAEWFAPLLTHSRKIEQINDAFIIASQYREDVWKMIVRP